MLYVVRLLDDPPGYLTAKLRLTTKPGRAERFRTKREATEAATAYIRSYGPAFWKAHLAFALKGFRIEPVEEPKVMPYVVRYIDDPHPNAMGSSFRYLAMTNAGEGGTTPSKDRAKHFRTKREAERAIAEFLPSRPEFRFAGAQSARKHFLIESFEPMKRTKKPPPTLWDRILEEDD